MDIAQIASLISLPIAIAALGYAARQARSNEYSASAAQKQAIAAELQAKYPSLLDLLREFRCKEFTATRYYIASRLSSEYPPDGSGLRVVLDQDRLLDILALMHFLDNLGLFVRARYVDSKYISMFIGRAIEQTWNTLLPYIEEERLRFSDYAEYFGYLATVCNADTQATLRRAL